MLDLLASSFVDRHTEISYVKMERDWLERARENGRLIDPGRTLPMLPAGVSTNGHGSNGHGGNGHAPHGHDGAITDPPAGSYRVGR
jgi:hypothetical protein